MSAPHNPPAFPGKTKRLSDIQIMPAGGGICIPQTEEVFHAGMTLRDWFAGQALAGLAASPMDMPAEAYGLTAYAIADAMLAAREQKA